MLVYPAIDLRGGRCVRLRQGDYSQEMVFGDDPVAVARRWVDLGAVALHLVDLDGAKVGRPINGEVIRRIVAAVAVPIQFGGGIRTEDDLQAALGWGVQRVILGTRALQDPAWVREMVERYPDRIVLGLDARDGKVATHGWLETSEVTVLDTIHLFHGRPLAGIVFTDIARDGMLSGPNFTALAEVRSATDIPLIASGGVTTLDDIRELVALKVAGCIIGRALYEGKIDLPSALAIAQGHAHAAPA